MKIVFNKTPLLATWEAAGEARRIVARNENCLRFREREAGNRHLWNGSSMKCAYRSVKHFLSFPYKTGASIRAAVMVTCISDSNCAVRYARVGWNSCRHS